jgi:hypothetical protein
MYQRGGETVRAILNRAFFSRLYVDGSKVSDQVLNEPFDILHEAYVIYRRRQAERPTPRAGDDTPTPERRCDRRYGPRSGQDRAI